MKVIKSTALLGLCLLMMSTKAAGYEPPPEVMNQYTFTLVHGAEHEVCRAYLEELNASPVKVEPYCLRFIEFKNKDFTPLKWSRMDTEFVSRMYQKVDNFIVYKDQDKQHVQRRKKAVRKPSKDEKPKNDKPKQDAVDTPKQPILGAVSAWRSEPQIDIDNDGQMDNFVIWQKGRCNTIDRPLVSGIFILDRSSEEIDSERMFAVIQHPDLGWKEAPNVRRFRFLTHGMGVFSYKGKSYLDGFAGMAEAKVTRSNSPILEVFIHEQKRTRLMCEYSWHGEENHD